MVHLVQFEGMKLSLDEEAQLIQDLLHGKAGAAKRFYRAYHVVIRTYVMSKTQTLEDAEEIVQDVFLAAMDSLGIYAGKSRLLSWLYGIARHEISDYYRKKQLKTLVLSHFPLLERWLHDGGKMEDKYAHEEVKMKIEQVLARMLPRYARVLRMKYLEGWSVGDMAVELDESLKAVEMALLRARKAFAVEWESQEGVGFEL